MQGLSGVAVGHQAMGLLAQEVQLGVEGKQQLLQTLQQQVSAMQMTYANAELACNSLNIWDTRQTGKEGEMSTSSSMQALLWVAVPQEFAS